MSINRRWVVGVAFAGLFASSVFAACATTTPLEPTGGGGSGGEGSSTGGGSSTTGAGGKSDGSVGSPCTTNDDCSAGECTQVGNKKFCTTACPPDCPSGTYCSIIEGDPTCIPDSLGQLCKQCQHAWDCAAPTDDCLTAPAGDAFCARDCTILEDCPNGFTCVDKSAYMGGGGGGMADAGTDGGDAGKPDSGSDAGKADAGDGGAPKPSMATKWCVPSGGLSCPCDELRQGVVHDCHVKNVNGECSGKETCDSKKGWEGCTAKTPVAEICNAKDDNCNAQVDEGDPNALCAASGPKPPNASWMCAMNGTCSIGPCDPGWAAFPPGKPSEGCTCPVELGEPNGLCAAATGAGMVSDAGGALVIQGTLSAADDIDFWSFDSVDTAEMVTNSYHLSIDFTEPNPNREFLMDVMVGDPCADVPTGPSAAITSYDWCVDGNDNLVPNKGEIPCGDNMGMNNCIDHSAKYYVRVYRALGVPATCNPYKITVTAKGGDPCDFSETCP